LLKLKKGRNNLPVSDQWRLEGDRTPCDLAVIIPALGEGEQLWSTLRSIATNPAEYLRRSVIVVVINSCSDSDPVLVQQNILDLTQLRQGETFGALRLAWVDATTAPRQLPPKRGGVGLARKIGCDLVLAQLDKEGILIQLDADTLVDDNYLPAVSAAFSAGKFGAAVIPYRHQNGTDAPQQRAITHYELYMRCHVLGLRCAGSPYAYHAIGSAIACKHSAYLKSGGMNCRRAGEDFYFLQQLAKTTGVGQIAGTVVRPAARISARTPFGTGQVINTLCTSSDEQQFYSPQCYKILSQWLHLVVTHNAAPASTLLEQAQRIDGYLYNFLMQENFPVIWQQLGKTHRHSERKIRAFHEWFDGLKTQRCLRYLSESAYPMATARHHVPELLRWARLEVGQDVDHWLETLIVSDSHPA
jgi:hypothetical protein